jgi:hypothetical protein
MNIPRISSFAACAVALLAGCGGTLTAGGGDGGTDGAPPGRDGGGTDAPATGHDGTAPGDGSTSSVCPADPPTVDTMCAPPGLECEFGSNPNAYCDQLFSCFMSGEDAPYLWVRNPTMNACPPQSDCPTTYPSPSTKNGCPPSDAPGGGENLECSYPQGTCICTQGSLPMSGGPYWQCFAASAMCPSPRPRIGSTCTDEGASCDYGSCEGGVALECKGGLWVSVVTPCPG